MTLSYVFVHLNAIVLVVWLMFLAVVIARFFRPAWFRQLSFNKIVLVAIALNILYGLFVTWGQYHVWATSADSRIAGLLNFPLPRVVSFPAYLEWIRPVFEHRLGYFLFYIFGRVWLNIFISFLLSGIVYVFFKIWSKYRGGFVEQGAELLFALMLISGYPGVLIMVPIGFAFSLVSFGYAYYRGNREVRVEPAFISATLVSVLFARAILMRML